MLGRRIYTQIVVVLSLLALTFILAGCLPEKRNTAFKVVSVEMGRPDCRVKAESLVNGEVHSEYHENCPYTNGRQIVAAGDTIWESVSVEKYREAYVPAPDTVRVTETDWPTAWYLIAIAVVCFSIPAGVGTKRYLRAKGEAKKREQDRIDELVTESDKDLERLS